MHLCIFDSELLELDTIRGMLDISLIYNTLLIAVCVDVTLALPHLITTIYHTQVFICFIVPGVVILTVHLLAVWL